MNRRRLAFLAVAAVFVLLFGGRWVALRYTESLWFQELGEGCGGGCCHVVLHQEGQRATAIMAGAVSQSGVGCRLGAFACFQHAGVPLLSTCASSRHL